MPGRIERTLNGPGAGRYALEVQHEKRHADQGSENFGIHRKSCLVPYSTRPSQLIRAGAAAIESATDEKLFPAGSATKVAVLEMVEVSDKDPRPEDQAFWKQKRASKVQCLTKVRPDLLNLQTEDTFQTLAARASFGPRHARLMSTHRLAG